MKKQPDVEFFYDCSSPWTWFAFNRIIPMMADLDVPIRWRPILVGGVFNAVNQQVYAAREALFSERDDTRKLDYYMKDMQDWARLCSVKAIMPQGHPISSVKAMRGAFFAEEQGLIEPYSRAIFSAYWGGENPDISSDDVLAEACKKVGLDTEGFFNAIADPQYKTLLRANTEEVIARGGFGSPTIFINEQDMYFGNDRLPLVEFRLRQLLQPG
tara:strand:+ start:18595 stop:19236 length:642 start_codon:yes stop_codon:yes gene_type:complete